MTTVIPKNQANELASKWDALADRLSRLSFDQLTELLTLGEPMSHHQHMALAYRLCARDLREACDA